MTRRITLYIDGMVCQNCEKRVEKALTDLNGINKVTASHKSATAEVKYDIHIVDEDIIQKTVEKLGYSVSEKPENGMRTVMPLVFMLLAVFYVIQSTIGFQFIPEVSEGMGYGLLFIVGLLTSIHCIAMCGGIALSQSIKTGHDKNNISMSLLYNTGRVISYTVIGGIVGSLGSVISPSGQFKGIIAIGAGIFMFLFGLKMLNSFTFPSWMKLRLPRVNFIKVSRDNPLRPFFVGLANGFMPCGPLQTMQLYALGTGSAIKGALSMFVFSVGTVPLMLGLGIVTSLISGKVGRKMLKVSAALVMVLGIIMLNRGLALSGISLEPELLKTTVEQTDEIRMEDGKQIVNMTIGSRSYVPDVKVLQAGIPVRINLDVESINGCNNPLIITQYGIEKDLTKGENFIEFIPTKEGSLTISCWMGMITTNLTVVEDPAKAEISKQNETGSDGIFGEGGCCGETVQGEDKAAKAVIDGKIQTIEMNVGSGGYSPNILVVQKGLQTKWIINGEDINSCTFQLSIPDADFLMNLKDGRNEINFTPESTGEIYFTCGMGMLYGKIVIADDLEKVNIKELQ